MTKGVPIPYHSFKEWPAFLVLAALFAAAAGKAVVIGYETGDTAFAAVFGIGLAVDSFMLTALTIQTRRYKLKWAPVIAADRERRRRAALADPLQEEPVT